MRVKQSAALPTGALVSSFRCYFLCWRETNEEVRGLKLRVGTHQSLITGRATRIVLLLLQLQAEELLTFTSQHTEVHPGNRIMTRNKFHFDLYFHDFKSCSGSFPKKLNNHGLTETSSSFLLDNVKGLLSHTGDGDQLRNQDQPTVAILLFLWGQMKPFLLQ